MESKPRFLAREGSFCKARTPRLPAGPGLGVRRVTPPAALGRPLFPPQASRLCCEHRAPGVFVSSACCLASRGPPSRRMTAESHAPARTSAHTQILESTASLANWI